MRIYLSILLTILFAPIAVFAAYTDAVIENGIIITVGGNNYTVTGNTNVDSIEVDSTKITLILSKSASIKFTSADRSNFTVSPSGYVQALGCTSAESYVTVGNDLWNEAITVTVTPSGTCVVGSGGGGGGSSGGGGGGGGGGAAVLPLATTPSTTATTQTPITPVIIMGSSVSAVFSSILKMGMTNSDIKRLQQLLNSSLDTQIASSGIGSPGNETEYFGSMTRIAVQKFQAKYGIVSSGSETTTDYGMIGPATRAKIQEIFGASQSVPTVQVPATPTMPPGAAVSFSAVFTKGLSKGMTNSDIKRLQQLLNSSLDTQIASSGIGSPGNETEYFGSMTEKAVIKFQLKYKLVTGASDPGYGYIGPKTRAKLLEVFGESVQTQTQTEQQTSTGGDAQTSVLESQIQLLLQQVQALQQQLQGM